MFTPLTRALVEKAGIVQGQSVLDVAGGPGEPSLTTAETVEPTGSVMCTDGSAPQRLEFERIINSRISMTEHNPQAGVILQFVEPNSRASF